MKDRTYVLLSILYKVLLYAGRLVFQPFRKRK